MSEKPAPPSTQGTSQPATAKGAKPSGLTRRKLLIGAAAGGGIIAAWMLMPRDYPVPLSAGEGERAFNAWLKVGRDGVVTVAVPTLEMGQGSTTLFPRIAAQELGADWRQVAVEPAAVSAAYADPVLSAWWSGLWSSNFLGTADDPGDYLVKRHAETERLMASAEGTGIAAYERQIREAAASVRMMLAEAAANRWDVDAEEVEVENGFVRHGDNEARFGELADEAALLSPPDPAPLRPDPQTDLMPELTGSSSFGEAARFPRLDAPSKVDGSYPFAGDIRIPGMVFAAIAHGPMASSTLDGFDPEPGRRVSGYLGRVEGEGPAGGGWLACVGTNHFAAAKALAAMKPRFAPGRELPDDARIEGALDEALANGTPEILFSAGDPDPALSGQGVSAAEYSFAPQFHGAIETATATARYQDGRLSVWIATQAPEAARRAAAEAIGINEADAVLLPVGAGGSFDARLDIRIAREVASIAYAVGRPVQLTYSREQEHLRELPLPPARISCRAIAGPQGTIRAWTSRIAAPPAARQLHERLRSKASAEAAMDAAEGLVDPANLLAMRPPYAIPDMRLEAVSANVGVPVGRLRGNGDIHSCFAAESFMDELARANGAEPLSFRIAMLGNNARLFECLQGVAQIAGWDGGTDGSNEGLACWQMADPAGREQAGGRIAVIANARLGEGGIEVTNLAAFCDIGRIVDYDLALQQVEGGLLYGMALALGMGASYDGGTPREKTLGALNLPRLGQMPEISVGFAQNDAPPFDPGEIGVVAVAPAIANALRAATGRRFRAVPLRAVDGAGGGEAGTDGAQDAASQITDEEAAPDAGPPPDDGPQVLPDGSIAQ
ncbi:molybdopterin cofactor-binding domain-containing protein [Croceicoccus mobilis]|uniref:Aldehyde dehydrogenase n=1 Tax=Croceicoccus mobilis TaxID=1703339 RepID=A0A916YUC0_9SPHN|nr:molybdopterin cofactor-binding domain-containing protein [Croceicoccus mobilis]GGD61634.1 aldehyde dehydrogenase [Croceicoccus mobilis]